MGNIADRRSLLKYGAVGLVGGSFAITASANTDDDGDPIRSIHLEDQQTDGRSVVVTDLKTRRASVLFVTTPAFEVLGRSHSQGPSNDPPTPSISTSRLPRADRCTRSASNGGEDTSRATRPL